MKSPVTQVLDAAAQARRAIRRGDIDAAERWLRIAERADEVATRVNSRLRQFEHQRRLAESR